MVMIMDSNSLEQNINQIRNNIGSKNFLTVKEFYIGKEQPLDAAIIFISGLVSKEIIDRDVLAPLMYKVNENLTGKADLADYLSKKYIPMSNTDVIENLDDIVTMIKRGRTAILINGMTKAILIDATGGDFRSIIEPENETTVKGARDGFTENLETNITTIKRRVKDKDLVIETFTLGRRTQSEVAAFYIDSIVDKNVLNELRKRIKAVDIDGAISLGMLQQYIEDYTYTVFPQSFTTERPDRAVAELLEGRIIVIIEGYPVAMSIPSLFIQFFQAVEDYNQRTVVASFSRILRIFAAFLVLTLPSIYLTLIKYNVELIPIKFVTPIVQSRVGIALTPFMEIVLMSIIVEFLREGGLRLPSKIAQTLSLVGGIIIGDTAIKSKIVSPATLLIVGVTVVATFLIPNYDMSLCIRILQFPVLILANMMGILGIAIAWFLILAHLSSLDSFGVPYFEFYLSDLKDTFIRAPLWKMNKRPEGIPNTNPTRQVDFRNKFRRNGNEQ